MECSIHKQLTLIVEVCKEVLTENLISIILFGSTARGDFNDYSDIDVIIEVSSRGRTKKDN